MSDGHFEFKIQIDVGGLFLSQVLKTLEFLIIFEAVLMPFIQLFDISYGLRDSENQF